MTVVNKKFGMWENASVADYTLVCWTVDRCKTRVNKSVELYNQLEVDRLELMEKVNLGESNDIVFTAESQQREG